MTSAMSLLPGISTIERNWVYGENTNWFKKEFVSRGYFFVYGCFNPIKNITYTALGVLAGAVSACTYGKICFATANQYTHSSNKIVSEPYLRFLLAINPEAKVYENQSFRRRKDDYYRAEYQNYPEGICYKYVNESSLLTKAGQLAFDETSRFNRVVTARAAYVALAVGYVFVRFIDACIGILAGLASIVSLGTHESTNNIAYRGLQATGLISDLVYCAVKFVNPKA